MSKYWQITDFAKMIGRHVNTVDGWFKQLEKRRLHYVNRSSNEKVYDELDRDIALFIRDRREEKWSLDAIFDDIGNHFELRPFPEGEDTAIEVTDIEGLKQKLADDIRRIVKDEIRQLENKIEEQQRFIEYSLNKRDERLIKALRDELETQKQLASAKEEKQGFFSRLFGKK